MCVCEFDVIKNTILLSIPLARRPNTISEDQANLDIPSTHLSPPDVTWRLFFLLLLLADDACGLCRLPFVSFATCGIPFIHHKHREGLGPRGTGGYATFRKT